jgi:probable HAF family extracellular repeat protein
MRNRHPALIAALIIVAASSGIIPAAPAFASPTRYRANPIGMSWTTALNDRRQVVGGTGIFVSTLWQNGTLTYIGQQVGDMWNRPSDINVDGWVAGSADRAPYAWLWRDGVVTDLGTLGGSYAYADGINDVGQIVGHADVPGGSFEEAFVWRNGRLKDIGAFRPRDINNNGDVAGTRVVDLHSRACVWHHGILTDLPVPGENTTAQAINDRGEILVESYTNDGTTIREFLWSGGHVVPIAAPDGQTTAVSVNNRSQVLVSVVTADGLSHPYLWQNRTFTDLTALGLDPAVAGNPVAINNRGDILTDSSLYVR